MKKTFLYFILICILFTGINYGHGDKKHKKGQDTVTVVNGDTIAVNGVMIIDSITMRKGTIEPEEIKNTDEFEFSITDAAFEHIHNKIIHFPIALTFLLLIFMILGYKVEICYRASKIIVILGLLFSIAAAVAGLLQATAFEGNNVYSLLELHRNLGFVSIIIWGLLTWVILKRKSWSIQFSIVLTLTILISFIGLLGGIIAQ